MLFNGSSVESLEDLLVKHLIESEYMLNIFLRKRKLCYCRKLICRALKTLTQRFLLYTIFYVDHYEIFTKDKANLICKIKKFLEEVGSSITLLSPIVYNVSKHLIELVYEMNINNIEKSINKFIKTRNLKDYGRIMDDILGWYDNMLVMLSGINIICNRCTKDYCVMKDYCEFHKQLSEDKKRSFIQFYIFTEFIHDKDLFSKVIDILSDYTAKHIGDLVFIVDGRYLITSSSDDISQYSSLFDIIEQKFVNVYYYRIPLDLQAGRNMLNISVPGIYL